MLFQKLPDHLTRMALFKVNTGCRDREVCGLKWDDEVKVPELDMPAEGLLGAARLAPSDPPSMTPAFNVAARRAMN